MNDQNSAFSVPSMQTWQPLILTHKPNTDAQKPVVMFKSYVSLAKGTYML